MDPNPKRGYDAGTLIAQQAHLKELIGMSDDRIEAGRLKKLINRARGKKAKARKLERLAAASRKRNR